MIELKLISQLERMHQQEADLVTDFQTDFLKHNLWQYFQKVQY